MLMPHIDPVLAYLPIGRDRRAETHHLQRMIRATDTEGRRLCDANPTLAPLVLPLLDRLEEIDGELKRLLATRQELLPADVYPSLLRQALASEGYTPWGRSPPPANSLRNG